MRRPASAPFGLITLLVSGCTAAGVGDAPPPPPTSTVSVAIGSPTNGQTLSGVVAVTGTATGEVRAVEVAVDGGAYAAAVGTSAWTYSLDTGRLAAGAHTLAARATGTSGATARVEVAFTVGAVPTHTVTFQSNGGSSVAAQQVREGSRVTRPADPTRTGFAFAGWFEDQALQSAWDFAADTVRADTTLYAKWVDTSTATVVTVDRATKYQTIDGFGFFGAMDVWWGRDADMVSDAWAAEALGDLGITIWRNEYYPPVDSSTGSFQDATWSKQRPVVDTLKRLADLNDIPLKFIFTVWSPPSTMKCDFTAASNWFPVEGTAPQSTKGGHTLCRNSWDAFATWLGDGVQLYEDAGIDLYALSVQNEPRFTEPYNSCEYIPDYYPQVLAYVGPKVKARFPSVKLFGAENMLAMEAGSDRNYFYSATIKANAAAAAALDILAVHGYSDGVVPTASSQMATLWSTMYTTFSSPMGKPLWMTETSGYFDTWKPSGSSGAADLGNTIYAALKYGHLSGWVWWQGSEVAGISEYNLMQGTQRKSKRYHVSKQFYRFIRPGARMVKADSPDDGLLVVAFEHAGMGTFTAVLINTSTQPKTVALAGADVPATATLHTTTSAEDCVDHGAVSTASFVLPASSVNTVVSGNVYESGSPVFRTR